MYSRGSIEAGTEDKTPDRLIKKLLSRHGALVKVPAPH